jgi:hypothetical protein
MDMGMESELLIPGVQHGEEADFRAKVSRIASDFEQGASRPIPFYSAPAYLSATPPK